MGELAERQQLVEQIFVDYDVDMKQELSAVQLQAIHADMRIGGVSLPQVEESIKYVCAGTGCEMSELFDTLQEMDRRFFLIQGLRWEFSMLDIQHCDTIPEPQAKWLLQAVHGDLFSKRKWETFLASCMVPGSGVAFAEIEVMLCNIPSRQELTEEEDADRREQEERDRKQREMEKLLEEEKERRRKQREIERKKLEAGAVKQMEEEDRRRKQEEEDRKKKLKEKEGDEARRKKLEEEEERGQQEAEERSKRDRKKAEEEERSRQELLEGQRLRELEERHRRDEEERKTREEQEAMKDEEVLKKAIAEEAAAEKEAAEARKKIQQAKDGRSKQEAEEAENKAKLIAKESRHKRIRYNLKVTLKTRAMGKLPKAVGDFKQSKLPDDDGDLQRGERLLKEQQARENLEKALDSRNLKELEGAINFVKRSGFETTLAKELIDANKVLLQLRRLERIRAEILELKQSTVAEIRSYQKPPPIVHTVMTAAFLILGHPEKETTVWKTVQALVGKTGKEGLKRRCLQCEPVNVDIDAAARAKELLSQFDLDEVRDVSAGAATFYVWALTTIEELDARIKAGDVKPKVKKEESRASRSKSKSPARRATPTSK